MKRFFALTAVALALAIPAAYAEEGAVHPDKAMKGDRFQEADTNGDGNVSKEEFLAKHETMFNKIDADADGMLTQAEMDTARAEWKAKMKEERELRKQQRAKEKAEAVESAPAETPADAPAVTEEAPAE